MYNSYRFKVKKKLELSIVDFKLSASHDGRSASMEKRMYDDFIYIFLIYYVEYIQGI